MFLMTSKTVTTYDMHWFPNYYFGRKTFLIGFDSSCCLCDFKLYEIWEHIQWLMYFCANLLCATFASHMIGCLYSYHSIPANGSPHHMINVWPHNDLCVAALSTRSTIGWNGSTEYRFANGRLNPSYEKYWSECHHQNVWLECKKNILN